MLRGTISNQSLKRFLNLLKGVVNQVDVG